MSDKTFSSGLKEKLNILEQRTTLIIDALNNDKGVNEFKTIMKEKQILIINLVEERKEEIKKLALDSHVNLLSKIVKKADDVEINNETNKTQDSNELKSELSLKIKNFRERLLKTTSSIDKILKKNEIFEETVEFISRPQDKIFCFSKDTLQFKNIYMLKLKCKGEDVIPIKWKDAKVSNYQILDSPKNTEIQVKGTACYTYWILDKTFTLNDDVTVVFNSNVIQTSYNNYIGVINEKVVTTSNCMCCNIGNAWYFKSNGSLNSNTSSKIDNKLKYNTLSSKDLTTLILVKFDGKNKKVSFKVNDEDEVYCSNDIFGESFRIVAGTCGVSSGKLVVECCIKN